ncbi:MAG TPA: ATP-binding cassette domain-containing protein [Gemmatimonadota bacterium]|jgi:ABC-type Fe3+/spermidine/putrescine transport system ATPase subunit/nucleotide-binding universal stress UspA family protein
MSIVLKDLTKRYGAQPVVERVSLEIQDGELFVLLGASGSGKSTILRIIAGLVHADEGIVLLHGRDVTRESPQERNTGVVFQNYSLFQHMTVADNVEFGLAVRGVPQERRASRRDELLALVGLAGYAARLPRQLSGGQQQRVAVARALAYEPSVLLLDEPFGALDVRIRGQLRRALREIQRSLGVTAILVTHDQEEAFELGDRIGVMDRGRLLEVGTPAELYHRPRHEFVAGFVGEANLLGARSSSGRVRVGEVELPLPISTADRDSQVQWAVLFRPEDLTLGTSREELTDPVVGPGTVEEVLPLGASERITVRLEPLAGVWPVGRDYGETGVVLRVVVPSRRGVSSGYLPDQPVWVGLRSFHVLPRLARRLLLWTDGSPAAEEALRLGGGLARRIGASTTVLCVSASEMFGRRLLARTRETLAGLSPASALLSVHGDAVEEVLGALAREPYDLAVVPGNPARGAAAADGAGPGAGEEIARRAAVSVLVATRPREALRRFLLCTAAGEPGKMDVAFGAQLARRTDARATLLYVDGPPRSRDGVRPSGANGASRPARVWIERHLEQGVHTLVGQGVRAEMKVRRGPVVDEILGEAAEGDYDLVVIGGHVARTRPDERNLALEILSRADRPVLIVRGTPES